MRPLQGAALLLVGQQPRAALAAGAAEGGGPVGEMVQWLREHGAKGLDGIAWGEFDKGAGASVRGIAAAKPFSVGAKIFSIPGNLSMYVGNELLHNQTEFAGLESQTDRLIMHLINEKRLGAQSVWAPHFDIVPGPDDFQRLHPICAAEELLANFSFLPVVEHIREYQRDVSRRYGRLKAYMPAVSMEDVRWGSVVFLSRAIGAEEFLPLVDLMNSELEPSVKVFCDDEVECSNSPECKEPDCNFYDVLAARDLAAGEELTLTYGNLPNDALFLHFGFTFPDNPKQLGVPDPAMCESDHARRALSDATPSEPVPSLLRALARESCGAAADGDGRVPARSAAGEL